MNLISIILNTRSQIQESIYCIILFGAKTGNTTPGQQKSHRQLLSGDSRLGKGMRETSEILIIVYIFIWKMVIGMPTWYN